MTRLLLRNGIVVTQDPAIGALPRGDVLIEAIASPRSHHRSMPRRRLWTAPATSCCPG